ncbi:DUF1465 family protein [Sphingomonas japonica]|uniref:Regulator of CtrA degradation n=1 Tax=Sphingomonas japonica TaxID=511662 RepID=A0ABX0U258_9SPHN|nr:DUF1465 family protein [Sphingomonas japonica]NIJ24653.1 regulator of CtrA degradation [Sphingomonas japonica]
MQGSGTAAIQSRLIDSLYVEAMLLADEARCYFDQGGKDERDRLDPVARVAFSCESLKVTTRLMHVIAWLLTQRAVQAGELRERDARDPSRRLGAAPETDAAMLATMPRDAGALIATSIDLYRRVARLDATAADAQRVPSPARTMIEKLALNF